MPQAKKLEITLPIDKVICLETHVQALQYSKKDIDAIEWRGGTWLLGGECPMMMKKMVI